MGDIPVDQIQRYSDNDQGNHEIYQDIFFYSSMAKSTCCPSRDSGKTSPKISPHVCLKSR